MPDNLSQRIIDFIANMPHFQHEFMNEKHVARRMIDGTVFMTPDDPDDCEEGFVTAYWQGDSSRRSDNLDGSSIAGLEIAEGVRIWVAMGEYGDYKFAYVHMAQHFAFKTGATIHCSYEDESELLSFLGNAARTLGKDGLISIIKAQLGLP